jgi:hypothetical protein
MSGVPGRGGPVPKRTDQRRRRNKPDVEVDRAPGAALVEQPEPDDNWHPIAHDWYTSLAQSGQSVYYQPSDRQVARLVAEGMHRMLTMGKFSAIAYQAIMSSMTSLLVTEGDRRRMRLELERAKPADADEDASVTVLSDWANRLAR